MKGRKKVPIDVLVKTFVEGSALRIRLEGVRIDARHCPGGGENIRVKPRTSGCKDSGPEDRRLRSAGTEYWFPAYASDDLAPQRAGRSAANGNVTIQGLSDRILNALGVQALLKRDPLKDGAVKEAWSVQRGDGLLAQRPPRPDLSPRSGLPDDTRLWAALQAIGGGIWGGCVYDVDEIVKVLQAGLERLRRR